MSTRPRILSVTKGAVLAAFATGLAFSVYARELASESEAPTGGATYVGYAQVSYGPKAEIHDKNQALEAAKLRALADLANNIESTVRNRK